MAPSTMRAGLYQPGNTDIVMDNRHPVKKPGKGHVLIRVEACGICHSDSTLLSGLLPIEKPFVLGHEACGYVEEFGAGVDTNRIKKGVLYVIRDFLPCAHGASGTPLVLTSTGFGADGALADYVNVDEKQLVPVPKGLVPEIATLAGCSTTTAYHALHTEAGLSKGTKKKVLIVGCGGLGHQAIQIARHFGATVYAYDIKPAARKLARDLGAKQVFDTHQLTEATKKGFTVDIVVDFVASSSTFTLALAAVRGNDTTYGVKSKIVMVGASGEQLNFSTATTIIQNVDIISSLYGTEEDQKAALELLATGVVVPFITVYPLEDANKIVDRLRAFEVTGRSVVMPGRRKSAM